MDIKSSIGVEFFGNSESDKLIRDIIGKIKDEQFEEIRNSILNGIWILNAQEQEYILSNISDYNRIRKYLIYRDDFRHPMRERRFPIYIVVEPSSICNLRCAMCFQQDKRLQSPQYMGKMALGLWKQIIDEASQCGCKALTIAGRGEPLVNPYIADMLSYAKGKFIELKLNTNGLLLTDKIIHAILDAQVDIVVFSNEAYCEEDYQKTRCGAINGFTKLVRNIERFNEIKSEKYPLSKTKTRVCGVSQSFIDSHKFYEFWKDKVDEVALTDYEERKDTYNNKPVNVEMPCDRLWQRLYIWWDGKLSPCDIDYLNAINLGRIDDGNSIFDAWNGNLLGEIREKHLCKGRHEIEPCVRCIYS